MREIPLTQGRVALVDDEDYERVAGNKWYCLRDSAWRNQVTGEYESYEKKRTIPMHRVIMNAPPGLEVDHINGDRLDNRKRNLRICTHRQNLKNMHNVRGGSSMYKGVHRYKKTGRWQAYITVDYKRKALGHWGREEHAAIAYNIAAILYHGDYACLNRIGR